MKVIYAAIAGDFLVAATKFAAATYTGSSSMFSEAVHSLVETGNDGNNGCAERLEGPLLTGPR
jgi:divalent metal cation (Fe/Co/Zn/Cd) transporter